MPKRRRREAASIGTFGDIVASRMRVGEDAAVGPVRVEQVIHDSELKNNLAGISLINGAPYGAAVTDAATAEHIALANGTEAAPTLTYTGNDTTGIYRGTVPESVNVTINGSTVATVDGDGLTVNGDITHSGGTVSVTGLAADTLDLADGSAAAPSLRFAGNTDTGLYRQTSPEDAVALTTDGVKALSVGATTTTVGRGAVTNAATNATAVGAGAVAQANYAVRVGTDSDSQTGYANGLSSVSIGAGAQTSGECSMALGENANARGSTATAVGCGATTSPDGTTPSDGATAVGGNSRAVALYGTAVGRDAAANYARGVAVGLGAVANAERSVAVGPPNTVGTVAGANSTASVAVGPGATAQGATSGVALGDTARARGVDSVAAGSNSHASGARGTAVGHNAEAGQECVVIGADSSAAGVTGAVALGSGVTATNSNGVFIKHRTDTTNYYRPNMAFVGNEIMQFSDSLVTSYYSENYNDWLEVSSTEPPNTIVIMESYFVGPAWDRQERPTPTALSLIRVGRVVSFSFSISMRYVNPLGIQDPDNQWFKITVPQGYGPIHSVTGDIHIWNNPDWLEEPPYFEVTDNTSNSFYIRFDPDNNGDNYGDSGYFRVNGHYLITPGPVQQLVLV